MATQSKLLEGLVKLGTRAVPLPYLVRRGEQQLVVFAVGIDLPETFPGSDQVPAVHWPGRLRQGRPDGSSGGYYLAMHVDAQLVVVSIQQKDLRRTMGTTVYTVVQASKTPRHDPLMQVPGYDLGLLCKDVTKCVLASLMRSELEQAVCKCNLSC